MLRVEARWVKKGTSAVLASALRQASGRVGLHIAAVHV